MKVDSMLSEYPYYYIYAYTYNIYIILIIFVINLVEYDLLLSVNTRRTENYPII